MSDDSATRKAQTKAGFERIASDYDAAGPGCFAHFGRRLVEVVEVQPGDRVLDVAAGRGAVLIPAAERVGESGEAVGIDLAEAMVLAAHEEATRRELRARVLAMDAEHLDFPDVSFDRVLCGFGIMFFPDLEAALGEMRRVLKPGGRLGVSTWRVSQAEDLSTILIDLGMWKGEQGWLTDPDHLERTLALAGFTDVRVQADSATFRYADLEQYWQNARGTGLRRAIDALDAAQLERARAALADRVRAHQRPDGIHLAATALLAVANR